MLHLKDIVKDYAAGSSTVEALRGVDITFRDSEFVAVLGPSGCGKTTMLNILGGLDRYTSGDLIINGKSTRDFTERDWDTYRNRSIGFVFQNYNLISHQSVLNNVELALTLSGVGKAERRERALAMLERVGLSDQAHKKPNQLSGGQMQRVAIARALVNNPDIILADEPTGALDSETSVQVLEILKEIAQDRLVVMVTHNQDLAERYATRIVRLLDGKVIGDTNPYSAQEGAETGKATLRHTSMSFLTALSLSLNNLLTKKARTFLTAFAGSIGIIGIALILALSTGFQGYIDRIQEDALSTYPLVIEESSADIGAMMGAFGSTMRDTEERALDRVYSQNVMASMTGAMISEMEHNDLGRFKAHLEAHEAEIAPLVNAIGYGYGVNLNIYKDDSSDVVRLNPASYMEEMMPTGGMEMMDMMPMASSMTNAWTEMLDNQDLLGAQYDVIAGRWPQSFDEIMLVVDDENTIFDMYLYSLGLRDPAEINDMMQAMIKGVAYESTPMEYTFDDLLALTYKLVLSPDYYEEVDGVWHDRSEDEAYMQGVVDRALTLSVVGILRPAPNAQITSISGAAGYTKALTEYVIEQTSDAPIVKAQLADPGINVLTGLPFGEMAMPNLEDIDMTKLPANIQAMIANMDMDDLQRMMESYMPAMPTEDTTYQDNIKALGVVSPDAPSRISIYPVDFESKDKLDAFIKDYNRQVAADGEEQYTITYTDYIGLLLSSVSSIMSAISYVLIAFVSISLIVSSIMIGIITYVSVLERTKEIGILKSMGASKRDISRVFNAETLIVGFTAGLIGILVTLLLTLPINAVIASLAGISGLAKLPLASAAILVGLSMVLTFIAGLIPSRVAARKDPVVALRTE